MIANVNKTLAHLCNKIVGSNGMDRKLGSHTNCKKPIKCMIMNCNGLKSQSKKASFCASIAHHNPDVIFDCESRISPDIATYSIFPENYSVHRKDITQKEFLL